MNPKAEEPKSKKDIYIALIGVIGVVATALFSNWDKLYPKENIVVSTYSGYHPTDNAETEIKYLLYITGAENQMMQLQSGMFAMQKLQLSKKFEDNPERLDKLYEIIDDELPRTNKKILDLAVKIQSQFFTIEEIRELNKFYSTPIMREFLRRQPLLMKTFLGEMRPIALEFQHTIDERFKEVILGD